MKKTLVLLSAISFAFLGQASAEKLVIQSGNKTIEFKHHELRQGANANEIKVEVTPQQLDLIHKQQEAIAAPADQTQQTTTLGKSGRKIDFHKHPIPVDEKHMQLSGSLRSGFLNLQQTNVNCNVHREREQKKIFLVCQKTEMMTPNQHQMQYRNPSKKQ